MPAADEGHDERVQPQLELDEDDFIHSYWDSDEEGDQPFDEDVSASYSESGSEPPEEADLAAEAEDMALYDLYNNSAVASPQPPESPLLSPDEIDTVLDTLALVPETKAPRKRLLPLALTRRHGHGGAGERALVVVEEDSVESSVDAEEDASPLDY
uniref:Uncharacterized protein n=1 Tax=Mycena chlorophos TaxID=658473 RepID=A0ABQ0L8C7_MYCCL|nr:predicted protein [Mycena chlorophos]